MATAKASFVYVTYIMSTPEKVFGALLDPELTRQYWGLSRNVSDWKVGSRWEHQDYEDKTLKVVGKVLESEPPSRLVLTWGSPADEGQPEKHSRVTFLVERFADAVRLTVTHDELEPESQAMRGISQGWPAILSSLKTLLESGKPMPMTTRRWGG
jgi:uncharacterized protein YndB with AHSA1/START domain